MAPRISALVYPVLYVSAAVVALQALLGGAVITVRSTPSRLVLGGIIAQAFAFIMWSEQLLGRSYVPGATVLVTLSEPREKFWGVLLEVTAAGISLRGLDLNSFDDFVHLVRSGEPACPAAVFFPMHRVERMEADEHSGDIPSLKERFQEKTGRPLAYLFGRYGE